ncbi:MAG TPA: hypothetical protein VEU77_02905 [Candidatus Acidoferrales bacterium]|nr:hypothetical protein [Candidatus Acidoferrales bacterium]
MAVDILRAELGVRHARADGEVRRAGHDLLAPAAAVLDGRELQLVGVRVLVQRRDLADPDVLP